MPATAPHRAEPRFPSHLQATVRLTDWDRVDKFVGKNLSRGGIFLAMQKPVPVASRVSIRVEIPDGTNLQVTGIVAHVLSPERAVAEGRSPGVGIKFDPLSPEAQLRLDTLLSELVHTWSVAGEPDACEVIPSREDALISAFRAELGALREKNLFEVLGVKPGVERIAIVEAYATQLARWNPDRFAARDDKVRAVVAEIVILLTHAHDTLMDDRRREALAARLTTTVAVVEHDEDDPAEIADSAPPTLAVADELIASGRVGEACEYLSRALEREPWNLYIKAAFHSTAGQMALEAGDIERAAHCYAQAVRACPENSAAVEGLRKANELRRKALRAPIVAMTDAELAMPNAEN